MARCGRAGARPGKRGLGLAHAKGYRYYYISTDIFGVWQCNEYEAMAESMVATQREIARVLQLFLNDYQSQFSTMYSHGDRRVRCKPMTYIVMACKPMAITI